MQPSPSELAAIFYAKLMNHTHGAIYAELEALCASNPDLATELRALHQTRRLLEELGRGASPTAQPGPGRSD